MSRRSLKHNLIIERDIIEGRDIGVLTRFRLRLLRDELLTNRIMSVPSVIINYKYF